MSTAYYVLFHLLISETVLNCRRVKIGLVKMSVPISQVASFGQRNDGPESQLMKT